MLTASMVWKKYEDSMTLVIAPTDLSQSHFAELPSARDGRQPTPKQVKSGWSCSRKHTCEE